MADKQNNSDEMKNLGNLSPAKGSNVQKKRLGRGIGSGLGKTSGKGHKGQWARKGGGVRAGFEGGNMPLYMRLPKRGFHCPSTVVYNVINLDQLGKVDGDVTLESLSAAGLIRDKAWPIKLLGRGTLDKKLNVTVHKASTSAKEAVEKAGGTIQVLGLPEKKRPERHSRKKQLAEKLAAKKAK